MGLTVRNPYLPGFTKDITTDQVLTDHLIRRNYDSPTGGAEIADILGGWMVAGGIKVEVGAQGFTNLDRTADARNHIVASCARLNCMSCVWWLVERDGAEAWRLYAGSWNEELAFMCLSAPDYHPVPVVWLTKEVRRAQEILKLAEV